MNYHLKTIAMKTYLVAFGLILPFLLASRLNVKISPRDILSGKYKHVLAGKLEYNSHIDNYNKAVFTKKRIAKQLDSLFAIETLSLWPIEEQKKLKTILRLAKNNVSGDVYQQMKEFGSEYAFTLNKIINVSDMYARERDLIRANNQIQESEEWATTVAEIAQYFYQHFLRRNLNEKLSHYTTILLIEKELQEISLTYKGNIASFIETDKNARTFYYRWETWKKYIKKSQERDTLYKMLEERFATSSK
jgi:hypothetical protein